MRLLIAIPVFNERRHVDPILARVLRRHDQVLVVDDGSTDGTPDLVAAHKGVNLLRHEQNRGYGQTLIDAFNWAAQRRYDWVITMDADDQHDSASIPDFMNEIKTDRWDIISGSRYLRSGADDGSAPRDRREINRTITAVLNAKFGLGITDAFCGFKAHRLEPTLRLGLTEAGYAFPLQLWPRVARASLRLTEIPVRLIYNDPNRYFGGALDDAEVRLRHYLSVLHENERWVGPPGAAYPPAVEVSTCCGGEACPSR